MAGSRNPSETQLQGLSRDQVCPHVSGTGQSSAIKFGFFTAAEPWERGLATSAHRPEPLPVYLEDAKSQPTGVQGLGFFKVGQAGPEEVGKSPPLQLINDCVHDH